MTHSNIGPVNVTPEILRAICLNVRMRREERTSVAEWTMEDIKFSSYANIPCQNHGYKDWSDALDKL